MQRAVSVPNTQRNLYDIAHDIHLFTAAIMPHSHASLCSCAVRGDPARSEFNMQAERCRALFQAYEQYLREARALARATIVNCEPFTRTFLTGRFWDGAVVLSRLSARDVIQFVQRQVPHLHRKRAKRLISALRSFLRYARYCGDVSSRSCCAELVNVWIPRGIEPDQIRQLLASIDRHTATGRRDYAILLLLARLGCVRAKSYPLNSMTLTGASGELTVRGKTGQRSDLPLSAEVGKAIAAYLLRGRPQSTCRRIFLRAEAPIRGFLGSAGIGSIVRHSLERVGIDAPTKGAHQFRHGLATEVLHHGSSLG